VTVVGRVSVVMYVSDQFVDGKLQLAIGTRVQSWGFGWGQDKSVNKNDLKFQKNAEIWWRPLANEPRAKGSVKNLKNLKFQKLF